MNNESILELIVAEDEVSSFMPVMVSSNEPSETKFYLHCEKCYELNIPADLLEKQPEYVQHIVEHQSTVDPICMKDVSQDFVDAIGLRADHALSHVELAGSSQAVCLDSEIALLVIELNKLGITTLGSCQGGLFRQMGQANFLVNEPFKLDELLKTIYSSIKDLDWNLAARVAGLVNSKPGVNWRKEWYAFYPKGEKHITYVLYFPPKDIPVFTEILKNLNHSD